MRFLPVLLLCIAALCRGEEIGVRPLSPCAHAVPTEWYDSMDGATVNFHSKFSECDTQAPMILLCRRDASATTWLIGTMKLAYNKGTMTKMLHDPYWKYTDCREM